MAQIPQKEMYKLMRVPWAGIWIARNYVLWSKRNTAT